MDKWFGEKRLWLFGNHLPLQRRFEKLEYSTFMFHFISQQHIPESKNISTLHTTKRKLLCKGICFFFFLLPLKKELIFTVNGSLGFMEYFF